MQIDRITSGPRLATVRKLFVEYAKELDLDLCFQSFEEELATLPGKYGPPRGALLLAHVRCRPAGVVALRDIGKGACEMKRLYVRPAYRGLGLGRLLAEAIVEEGRRLKYRSMKLDTVPKLKAAIALYEDMGFRVVKPYYHNPIEDAVFMARRYAAAKKRTGTR